MTAQKLSAPKGTPAIPPRFLIKMMLMLNISPPPPEPYFVKPDNWDSLTPDERKSLRLENWASGNGIKFADEQKEKEYKERIQLLLDVLDMDKKPERVPVFPLVGVYPQRRVGLNPKSLFYDQHKQAALAHIKFFTDMEPDFAQFALMFSGPALDVLGYKVMDWPGQNLPPERSYQFNEFEFLKADEYEEFLFDPTDTMLHKVFPRMFENTKGLSALPKFSSGYLGFSDMYLPFAFPEVQEALGVLKKAGELTIEILPAMTAAGDGCFNQGYPGFYGTMAIAPYDALGDVLRSTRGVMMDMFRRPDDVIAACEKFAEIVLSTPAMSFGPSPLVFIPLHKGADRFMSQDQFEKFYWPTLKKVMLGLIEDGYIPAPFCEGGYNNRLENLAELPDGSCLYLFDQTDMKQASEALRGKAVIMGNVPASLTATGTPEEMTAYCKDLIETCGPDGNFVLSNGCQVDEAKEENLKAMIDSVKKYSV